METEELKILLAVEPKWTVSINGLEFMPFVSSDFSVNGDIIRFGHFTRRIVGLDWLRPNTVRIEARARFRSHPDTITFYPGDRLPSSAGLRKKRRRFQAEIRRALCEYFGERNITREALYSDRRHGVGGAYPRFVIGDRAVLTVDPDESTAVIDGLMRAALTWAPLARRRVAAVVPRDRRQAIASRLQVMEEVRRTIDWLEWNGDSVRPLDPSGSEPETYVHEYMQPDVGAEVARICGVAPDLLRPMPHIAAAAVSIRLRGLEIARVSQHGTTYPFGDRLAEVVREIDEARRYGTRHPLGRAHEERWLESNLVTDICRLIPSIDARHIYPQVPSFSGEQRSIIDLLTVTAEGRLVVIEIKAAPDPDLPFQALDYWIAVERHRKAGDFQMKGYFAGRYIKDEPALLVLVAPLLAYHRTAGRMIAHLPADVPLMEIGIIQAWKRQIKLLRRKGMVS
jgi:hypothetical protein